MAPNVLSALQRGDIELALGDAAYDSENIRNVSEDMDIFFVSPMNLPNQKCERKDAYGRVIPDFLKTQIGKWLLGLRTNIKRVFNQLKINGLEQPRWYGFRRYQLHVQFCILMREFEFLLYFCNTINKLRQYYL
ncbi:hypothetical protein NOW01_00895 [Anoxybacillus salavatliensis]|nr:hypothetical protein [Anoxybacillus gonensis]